MKKFLSLVLLFIFVSSSLIFSQSFAKHFSQSALSGLFHYYEFPLAASETEFILDNAKSEISRIAEWSFSAMIYGLNFTFVPNSILYQVERDFKLKLRGNIDTDKLVLEESHWDEELVDPSQMPIEYLATYYSKPHEIARREFWNQSRFFNCTSTHYVDFTTEKDPLKAIEAAIQKGIIDIFSAKLINKPRMICGKVILAQTPRIYFRANRLYASVNFLVEEENVNSYQLP